MLEKKILEKHRLVVCHILSEKLNALCDFLQKYDVKLVCHYLKPEGGYYLWITLPFVIDFSKCIVPVVAKENHVIIFLFDKIILKQIK